MSNKHSCLPAASQDSEKPSQRVLRNSLWMIAQPLLLNALSIVVIGYMTRVLGQADYGRFIFGFSFVAIFSSFTNLGLRAVTVREVAKHSSLPREFVDRIFTTRLILALLSASVAVVAISLTSHDPGTKWVVCLASLTIVLQAVTTTFQDVFQARERMALVASIQAASGLVLTAGSVVALIIGMRLKGVTASYVLGGAFGLAVSWMWFVRDFQPPRWKVDVSDAWATICHAAPFFVPLQLSIAGNKLAVVILSSVSGYGAAGLFGAASGLVERLSVIPDGICSALYPAMANSYSHDPDQARRLFRQFFLYSLMLALPLAVGTTLLAPRILALVYGAAFSEAAAVLRVLVWCLFISFLASVNGWTLLAIHRERQDGVVKLASTAVNVSLCIVLIPWYGERGAAWASLCAAGLDGVLLSVLINRYLSVRILDISQGLRVLAATAVMAVACHLARDLNVVVVIGVGIVTYFVALVSSGILPKDEWRDVLEIFLGRRRVQLEADPEAIQPGVQIEQ
ncbi:MAG: flippase [Acidobacteriota bacterium]